jgi:hypothetical protein
MDLSEYNSKIYGVPEGVFYGQNDWVDDLNTRTQSRQYSDFPLPPNFDPRPAETRYSIFPMLDKRMPTTVPIESNFGYAMETNFTPPITTNGPVAAYINNVNVESNLRNQYFALQKGADQSSYVPSSKGDLYNVYVPSRPSEQPYPLLFEKPVYEHKIHPNLAAAPNIGRDLFHNNTRTQLRNTTGASSI